MPSASKYIIDVANIKPGGNSIKELWVGNSESKYAMHGNTCIYDKVLYELSVNDISNVEPNAQTVTFTYTSKKTHGNGSVDTLGINPTTSAITANHSTASTKTTTCTVKQSLTNNGTLTGNSVNVTVTQIKNYPTGLTLTISPKSTIPAAGGYITTALTNYNYTVTATYKSGSSSAVTSDANTTITANVTGVTAGSKGTTASTATVAGTITFTAKYVCNGKTVTTTANVNIMQDKNEVVSYANPTFTLSPGNTTLPASGGSVTGSVSAIQQVRTWSSTSTDTITPASTIAWTAQTISCESRGTVTGDTLTLGTTKVTVTANGKSTSKSYVVYQQANGYTDSWNNPVVTITYDTFSAGGETKTPTTCSATQSGTRTWTSGSQTGITNTSFTWGNYSMTNGNGFTLNNATTGEVKADGRGTTEGAARSSNSITRTATGAGNKQGTGSVKATQEANSATRTWGEIIGNPTGSCPIIPASGGTVTATTTTPQTLAQKWTDTYTSGSAPTGTTNQSCTVAYVGGNTATASSRGTTTGGTTSIKYFTLRATSPAATGSKTKDFTVTAYQEKNEITATTWNDPVVTLNPASLSFTSDASSQNITASATQSGVQTYTSKATGTTSHSSFTWYWSVNGTGFSVGNTGNVTSNTVSVTANPSTSQRTGSVIAFATATVTDHKTGSNSATLTQEAGLRGPYYGSLNLDSVTLSCADVPAGGGTVTPSWAGTVYQYTYYLTPGGQETNTGWTNINSIVSVSWSPSSKSASSLGTTEKARTSLGDCTATFTGYSSKTASKSVTVYQQANTKTEQITYSDLRDTCYFRNNYPSWTGETVTFTSAGTIHIGNVYTNSIILRIEAKMKQTTTISYTSGAGSTTTGETGCLGYATCSENWLLRGGGAPIDVGPISGDIDIKANANPNTTQRTATIHTSFTWEGMTATKDLVVTQEAAPDVPPTPTGYSFTITNESNYDLHLAFTTTNGTFQQDFVGGTGEIVTVTSTTLPITVVEVAGSISPGSDHTKIIELYNGSGTITASFELDYNAWYGTGQITVNDTGLNNITIIVS